MRHADDARFGDARVTEQDVFDFCREDVESGDDDQVLGAVDEVDEAILVAVADVSGAQPSIRGEDPRRRLGIVEIAGEDVGAAHPQLPGVADEDVVTGLVDDAQLDAVEHGADGAVARCEPGRRRDDRRCFGEAIPLGDDEPESLLQRFSHRHRELGRPGVGDTDRREGVGRRLLELAERHPHGGCAEQHGDLSLTDRLDRRRRIEALHEQQRRPGQERLTEDDVEPVHVVQRDHAISDVTRADVLAARACLLEVRLHAAVGEHRRLRGAGGSAREQQGGEVVGLDVDHRRRVRSHDVGGGDRIGDLEPSAAMTVRTDGTDVSVDVAP